MDDLYPSEFEVLIGSLMVLLREEKDVDVNIIDDISDNASPLAKKLFKLVALHTHPDKVKDERLNRFFLAGRKAQEQNDVLTLLFILSKCSPKNVLADGEIEELKVVLGERHTSVANKKDTVTYKWNTYTEEVKQVLIKHLV